MDELLNHCVYHLFIDSMGQGVVIPLLDDFFREVHAKKISDYPIWIFEGVEHKHDYFVSRLSEVLLPLRLSSNPDENRNTWKILLMGPRGHNGFSGLF